MDVVDMVMVVEPWLPWWGLRLPTRRGVWWLSDAHGDRRWHAVAVVVTPAMAKSKTGCGATLSGDGWLDLGKNRSSIFSFACSVRLCCDWFTVGSVVSWCLLLFLARSAPPALLPCFTSPSFRLDWWISGVEMDWGMSLLWVAMVNGSLVMDGNDTLLPWLSFNLIPSPVLAVPSLCSWGFHCAQYARSGLVIWPNGCEMENCNGFRLILNTG